MCAWPGGGSTRAVRNRSCEHGDRTVAFLSPLRSSNGVLTVQARTTTNEPMSVDRLHLDCSNTGLDEGSLPCTPEASRFSLL